MSLGTKLPTVSFIVPNYNYGHYLGECLESAVRQTYTDWEIVIVDDSSRDNSREIARSYVEQYPEKIRLIELQDGPGGPPRAINAGIRAMRGRYFSWLSSDDRCHPQRLEKLVAKLDRSPSAGMVHTAFALIDSDGCQYGVTVPQDYPRTEAFFRLLQGNIINGSTVLVRKTLLDEIGPLLETHLEFPDLLRVSEYILWLDLSMRADVALVAEVLHDYRLHQLNAEYNGSSLGSTLVRIAKRYFIRKYGLRNLVSRLCARSGCSRSSVYTRISSILLPEGNVDDIPLFVSGLSAETAAEFLAFENVAHEIERTERMHEVLQFYLTTDNAVTRDVLKTLRKPTPQVEQLALKLLNKAKAEYRSGNLADAIAHFEDVLLITQHFPSMDQSARYYLGMALEQSGRHDDASDQFEALLQLNPGHKEAAALLTAARQTMSKV
jgi:glycosyltransferase involved in cell wall biosynthesis